MHSESKQLHDSTNSEKNNSEIVEVEKKKELSEVLQCDNAMDFLFKIEKLSKEYSYTEMYDYYLKNKWQDLSDLDTDKMKNVMSMKMHKQVLELLLDKLGEDSNNFDYIKSLIQENKIPESALLYFDTQAYQKDIPPSGIQQFIESIRNAPSGMANYLYHLCNAAIKTKNPEAGKFTSNILLNWDDKIKDFYKLSKNNFKDTNEERIKFTHQNIENQNFTTSVFASMHSNKREYFLGSSEKETLINNLSEFEDEEIIDDLIDLIKTNKNGALFIPQICDTINKIKPDHAINQLLELLNSEERFIKENASSLLYRLEFGQIGISKKGVKYLNKIYDLGEDNKEDYHVSRLTSNGDIGIFNKERELIKYYNLGDLSTPDKKIKAEVVDFVYKTLFIDKKDEKLEEREQRLKYLEEFKKNYYKEFSNSEIFKDSNVRLNNLSFKEQGWFVIYFNKADRNEKENLKQFIQQYGEDGIKTFLSAEYGTEYGDRILEISKIFEGNADELKNIFKIYNKINKLSKNIGDIFKNVQNDKKELFSNQIMEGFVRRAKDILNTLYLVKKEGQAQAKFWGRNLQVNKISEIENSLETLKEALDIVNEVFNDGDKYNINLLDQLKRKANYTDPESKINQTDEIFESTSFLLEDKETGQKKHLIIQNRSYAAFYGDHLKDSEFDGEARMNFIIVNNPKNPEQPVEDIKNPERSGALSIRIDREGQKFNDKGELLPVCDPTSKDGAVSVDIGSFAFGDKQETQSDILGKVIAIGNDYSVKHDATQKGKLPEAYHNRASFSPEFGQADKFAEIVQTLQTNVNQIIEKQKLKTAA